MAFVICRRCGLETGHYANHATETVCVEALRAQLDRVLDGLVDDAHSRESYGSGLTFPIPLRRRASLGGYIGDGWPLPWAR